MSKNNTDDIYLKNNLGNKSHKPSNIKSIILFVFLNVGVVLTGVIIFGLIKNDVINIKGKAHDKANSFNNDNYEVIFEDTESNDGDNSFDYSTMTESNKYIEDNTYEENESTEPYTESYFEEDISSIEKLYDRLYGIVNTEKDPLNLRKNPSTDSYVLTQIPKGTKIQVISDDSEWLMVRYLDIEGYVSKKYILISDDDDLMVNSWNDDNLTNTKTGTIVTEKDPLNVREAPSINAALLGTVPKGSQVIITADSGEWYEIDYGSHKGYISKKYVEIID